MITKNMRYLVAGDGVLVASKAHETECVSVEAGTLLIGLREHPDGTLFIERAITCPCDGFAQWLGHDWRVIEKRRQGPA